MKPAEVAFELQKFNTDLAAATDDELLDEWIALRDKTSRVPDLDVMKTTSLEAMLIQRFGIGKWLKLVEARSVAK